MKDAEFNIDIYTLVEVLKMSTRYHYEEELAKINDSVFAMGADIEEAIDKTILSFRNLDTKLAIEIMKHDDIIDAMEYQIEEDCVNIVVKQQPIASDWRKIASYTRMIADMERIADHCSDIAIYVKELSAMAPVKVPERFSEIFNIMKQMVSDTFSSFTEGNPLKAANVIGMDDQVDKCFDEITREIAVLMKEQPDKIPQYIDYLLINKYIERMADHAANIADWVTFIVNGELKLKFTDRYKKESE